MQYSIERANLLTEQLRQLSSRHPFQLAGHHANLDFWLAEAYDAIRALNGYNARFRKLRDAQVSWVRTNQVRVLSYCPICKGACEFGSQTPPAPIRTPSEDIDTAKLALRKAVVKLLVRFHHIGLITETEVRSGAAQIDAPFDREDFELMG